MAILNQYSFITVSGMLGLGLAFGLWRWQHGSVLLRLGILALYVVGAIAFGSSRRYPQEEAPLTLAQIEATLSNDRATFVMLYSNY